ncbi:arrestin domain-containing protein 3-like [Acanthaster planci]|uniref:Arrestin domain-containing protein 3-like n=1 Tax=Acanthaster planci TaxID=133434 RepID=A0A8B7ZP00_ACAPL|nr:arrestin domain-containing protein 3-like [Acanthaster planci]
MGKLRELEIIFDGEANLFSQNDIIKGEVVLTVDNDKGYGLKDVKGVWVRFRGKAKTKWTTTTRHQQKTRHHTHSLKENYFDTYVVLFGTARYDHDERGLHIPPGRNNIPFQFQLPATPLPSPFEGKYGYVRYQAKATVSLIRTFSNKDYKSERFFSLIGPSLDLNQHPETLEEVHRSQEVTDCCGCTCTPEMLITAGLRKTGYVPGEGIFATGQVDNREGNETVAFELTLLQVIEFRSRGNTKSKTYSLSHFESDVSCPKGQVTNFTVGPLLVPPVPASGLLGCSIIGIEYYVEVETEGFSATFEVIIGTVPHQIVSGPSTAATAPPIGFEGIELSGFTNAPSASPPEAPPPPSYEEVVGVVDRLAPERDPEEYFGNKQFVPRYPYFNLQADGAPVHQ